jgi:two-component system KDP operon response regulator KdpE
MNKTGLRILIIEDELSVSSFLASTLNSEGMQIKVEANGKSGLQAAIEFRPELIILDLGLPDQSGIAVLKSLRAWSQTPVIILTASDSDQSKVEALDEGADDYLTKPFSVPELLARIRVAIRHANPGMGEVLRFGRIEIDLKAHSAKIDQKLLSLTSTEYEILKVLIKNSGKVVTHRTLLKEIWGPNSVEHTQYLRVYVGLLRKKFHVYQAENLILTEAGIGYRLIDTE